MTTFMNGCGKLHLARIDLAAGFIYERTLLPANHAPEPETGPTRRRRVELTRVVLIPHVLPYSLFIEHCPDRRRTGTPPLRTRRHARRMPRGSLRRVVYCTTACEFGKRPRLYFLKFCRRRHLHSIAARAARTHAAQNRPPKWSRPGSNRQPPPCKGGALPVELRPRSVLTRSRLVAAAGPSAAAPAAEHTHQQERDNDRKEQVRCKVRHAPPRDGAAVAAPAMGPRGVEPLTSSLSGTRSNQLSYEPARNPKTILTQRSWAVPSRSPLAQRPVKAMCREQGSLSGVRALSTGGDAGRYLLIGSGEAAAKLRTGQPVTGGVAGFRERFRSGLVPGSPFHHLT